MSKEQRNEIMNNRNVKPENTYIVQKYIKKPHLFRGHKYDFRIYVLITSVINPMTIYLYDDGIVRLASDKYNPEADFDDPFVHLTNYSLNKNSKTFDSKKHKLRLKDVLRGEMTSTYNGKTYRKRAEDIWQQIEQIITKTMYSIQP